MMAKSAKSLILLGPNSNPKPNYLGFGYKGLFFVEIMFNNEKHGQGTHNTKMGADKSAENTPNVPK